MLHIIWMPNLILEQLFITIMKNCWPIVSCLDRASKLRHFSNVDLWLAFKQHNSKPTKKLMQTSWFQTNLAVYLSCVVSLFFSILLPVVVFPWSVYISCGSQIKEKISGKGAYLLPQITEETVIAYPLLVHTSHVTYWTSNHRILNIILVIENFVAGQRLRYTNELHWLHTERTCI